MSHISRFLFCVLPAVFHLLIKMQIALNAKNKGKMKENIAIKRNNCHHVMH